mmetsp:Transcript_51714/g.138414  ORF Transcript_51714/g.138414 Transcript_51714/m.138414 type:complete len:210 (-) Transcript_51714:61-690(-)
MKMPDHPPAPRPTTACWCISCAPPSGAKKSPRPGRCHQRQRGSCIEARDGEAPAPEIEKPRHAGCERVSLADARGVGARGPPPPPFGLGGPPPAGLGGARAPLLELAGVHALHLVGLLLVLDVDEGGHACHVVRLADVADRRAVHVDVAELGLRGRFVRHLLILGAKRLAGRSPHGREEDDDRLVSRDDLVVLRLALDDDLRHCCAGAW